MAASSYAVPATSSEIYRAIEMHRFDQARLMIAAADAAGASGETVERALAALAFAEGRNEEALKRLTALLRENPDDSMLLEQATIAALRTGQTAIATRFAIRAVRHPAASWRAWNARGVTADRASDWSNADRAYAQADALAPRRAETANNLGWSRLLRGDWPGAADAFERAVTIDPASVRMANNLDLARIALAQDLPTRRAQETSTAYAARLNDAGVAAQARGDAARARAAFAQAIVASGHWYARANANLASVEGGR
ncbi:MAG: hypothetical protein M3R03_07155 [Pseudomonadota bacterium]|nr:hypothetical protein [Pseudomonadota bacterium]